MGVYDRCTPLLSSQISIQAAMLSSFEETSRAFKDKRVNIGINTIRRIAQCFANRAKLAQRINAIYMVTQQ